MARGDGGRRGGEATGEARKSHGKTEWKAVRSFGVREREGELGEKGWETATIHEEEEEEEEGRNGGQKNETSTKQWRKKGESMEALPFLLLVRLLSPFMFEF